MTHIIEFETKRLLLRQWKPSDRTPFAALNADAQVMEFYPSLLSTEQSDAVAERCETGIADRGWGLWAVETKENAQFIGVVGLNPAADTLPLAGLVATPCVEIAWRLAAAYWGKGLAAEAAQAALRVGFDVLELSEIVSFTARCNDRSQALMQRIGMHNTGHTFMHPHVALHSPLREHVLYRLERHKFTAGRPP